MKVKECMSLNPIYVSEECTIDEVAKLMSDNHIGVIPVCDEAKNILGIVTDRDIILRSIACDKDVRQTPITEIMSKDVIVATADLTVSEVAKKMQDNQVRRIPVTENNQLVGMITTGDLAKEDKIGGKELANTMECICECQGQIKNAE